MAERFGGKYSPGRAASAPSGQPRRTRAGARTNILLVAPLPLGIIAFFREPAGLFLSLAAFGMLMLAGWLTREGLIAEEAYEARTVARRPAMPRKMIGSALMGLGLALAVVGAGQGALAAGLLGLLGAGLHLFSFGPDPLRNKGIDGVDAFQTDRVARAVDEAERHLAAMREAIENLRDRKLTDRVDAFQATARRMFRTVEQDPRDLTSARRYLGVYLLGARDAAIKFSDLYGRTSDAGARRDFEALLDDLEQSFAQRTETLLLGDRTNLDVEIGVLRDRLAREGVRME